MNVARATRMIGAPVAVVLATVVNASAFPALPTEALAPDLSWVVRCGATETDSARSLLARRAASEIRSIDRFFGAEPAYLRVQLIVETPCADSFAVADVPGQRHTRSTYQHAAP
jgi:hypothetical protein